MRIGILTDVYRSGFSGVANHVSLLKKSFTEQGHKVVVFAFEKPGKVPTEPDVMFSPGITVTANYPFGLRLSRSALKEIQTMQILHVHQPFASGSIAMQLHRINKIPLIFTSHTRYDLFSETYLPWIPPNLSLFAVKRYLNSFSNHLKQIIAPSSEMAALLKSWDIRVPIQVIPNGINLDAFCNRSREKLSLHARLGLPDETFIYLYAGRIASEKNIPFVIDCFARICGKGSPLALVLAGGGPKDTEIQRYITSKDLNKQVIMVGRVDYEDMPAIMHAADAFVTASKSEVHPLTLIEAAASGLPTIALDAPGVRSIVQNHVTGILCQEDQEQFASQMQFLANNRQLSRQFGENAAQAAQGYSHTVTACQVLDLYQSIIYRSETPGNCQFSR